MQSPVQPRILGRWIYVVGIALLSIVVLAGSFPGKGRWIRVLHDSGHGYIFAIIAVLCLLAWRRMHADRLTSLWAFAGAWLVASGIGLATEVAQRYTSRDASWGDVAMDAVGAAFGLTVLFAYERARARRGGVFIACILAAVLAVAMLRSTAIMISAYWQRNQAFPVIAQFDQYYGRYFTNGEKIETWIERLSPQYSSTREYAMHVDYQPSDWSILVFTDFVPDWSNYTTLVIDIVNPEPEMVRLSLRASDKAHQIGKDKRFVARFKLPPQSRQQLRVSLNDIREAPEHRDADLSNMEHIGLFKSGAKKQESVLIVGVWLE